MQRLTYPAIVLVLSAAFGAILTVAPCSARAAQQGKALREQEVIELLQGDVPSSRVAEIVDERGIDFEFTSEIERKVRDARGGDDVVAALRRASDRRAAAERPRTGGLIIKTTPGETQVYLNDEPRGMTSPEGEIHLPDLEPGTYNLRVSLLGYQSYEKPMTVAPGEEQTVYVTLLQKTAAVSPRDNPPAQVPAEIPPGIPVPGVKVSALQFYEGPHDTTPEKSQRVYRSSFARSATRSIYWELDLTFPDPGRQIDFQLEVIWYKPDGSELARQPFSAYVKATWPSSWHSLGYGWVDVGHWPTGTYRVDVYCRNARVASREFQVF